jgi:hypothetical protein
MTASESHPPHTRLLMEKASNTPRPCPTCGEDGDAGLLEGDGLKPLLGARRGHVQVSARVGARPLEAQERKDDKVMPTVFVEPWGLLLQGQEEGGAVGRGQQA